MFRLTTGNDSIDKFIICLMFAIPIGCFLYLTKCIFIAMYDIVDRYLIYNQN